MKNTLEGINSRIGDTKEHISDLEDRIMEITQAECQKEKQIFKMRTVYWISRTTSNIPTFSQKKREKRWLKMYLMK